METEHVELPLELLRAANFIGGNLSQENARQLALELYREDMVSLERAAELCHTPLAMFMDLVAACGVPPVRYSYQELEEERRSTDRPGS